MSLPARFGRLSHDNRNLLRKIVSLQDDERRDMARELHDELGPLLFGIRANAVALVDDTPQDKTKLESSVQAVVAVGRGAATGQPPHPRPAAAALHPGIGARLKASHTLLQERPVAGARPHFDIADRSRPKRSRRPAFADRLPGDPGRPDQRSPARQRPVGADRSIDRWRARHGRDFRRRRRISAGPGIWTGTDGNARTRARPQRHL